MLQKDIACKEIDISGWKIGAKNCKYVLAINNFTVSEHNSNWFYKKSWGVCVRVKYFVSHSGLP